MESRSVMGQAIRQEPRFSVIVVAHTRTQYLEEAVDSVLGQTFERSGYEVLLIGNYSDPELDERFRRSGVRVLHSPDHELGPKLAEAVTTARGDVMVFLEDDDLFEPAKLAEVARRFDHDESLGYYHNNFAPIDGAGAPYRGKFLRLPAQRRIQRKHRVYLSSSWGPRDLGRLVGLFPGFNNSCISMRRSILLPQLAYLRQVNLMADELLWFAALDSGAALLLDESLLTRYRIHGTSVSNPMGADIDVAIDRLRQLSEATQPTRGVLRRMVTSENRREILLRLAEAEERVQEAIMFLRQPTSDRERVARLLIRLVSLADIYEVRSFPFLAPAAGLLLLSPRLARQIYGIWKSSGL